MPRDNPPALLVIRLSSMGDVVLSTALFEYVKASQPLARIFLLTAPSWLPFFKDDPRLEIVVGVDKKRLCGLPPELAEIEFDHIVDLQNNRRTRAFVKAHFPRVPCGSFNKLHWQRSLLLSLRVNTYPPKLHAAVRYVKAYDPAALNAPDIKLTVPDVPLPSRRTNAPAIALFPFSAWKNKQWPLDSFAAVGRHFAARGWQVLLFGGHEDRADAASLENGIGEGAVSFAGVLDLPTLLRTLADCRCALGNDTGLSHCARAVGVPTVMIFGATTRHFGFYPYGTVPHAVVERREWCRPCHAHGGNHCLRGNRPCLTRIDPERVVAALENLA